MLTYLKSTTPMVDDNDKSEGFSLLQGDSSTRFHKNIDTQLKL